MHSVKALTEEAINCPDYEPANPTTLCSTYCKQSKCSIPKNGALLLDLRLTHQEIAQDIGTTRVTVTRLLNRLKQEKKIIWSARALHFTERLQLMA